MRRVMFFGCVLTIATSFGIASGCDDDATPSNSSSSGGTKISLDGEAPRAILSVDCAHPGAGRKLENGQCECVVPAVDRSGAWNGLYTCREGTTCVDRDKEEEYQFTQDGNHIHADDAFGGAASFVFDGVVCGDWFVWSGGPVDGKYKECGWLHFLDANHYVKDSCYQYADGGPPPDCTPSFAASCPNLSGQCTNSGARKPEGPPPIDKTICQ